MPRPGRHINLRESGTTARYVDRTEPNDSESPEGGEGQCLWNGRTRRLLWLERIIRKEVLLYRDRVQEGVPLWNASSNGPEDNGRSKTRRGDCRCCHSGHPLDDADERIESPL